MLGISRENFVLVLQGRARLSARYAYFLSEIFGWERAARWWWMQGKCDMYAAAVTVRRERRALNGIIDEQEGEAWEDAVAEAWEKMAFDEVFEEKLNPSIKPEDVIDVTLKEELENARLE